ncbi:LysR family transcriptional regulator [Ralstonia holmesii]|uniref:HTH-type transcriptional regulator YofA n=1 Tax=Ralstonia holmesii TaxID=3058602 RepID=A0ABC8QEB4_9RALS|nr:LysR family transcriptional regulator [Ralstonia sp. LMG 32967]CAJ0796731.1 HTH-type transcriptional regulator YofA [Ralstonia sp. LMG 32967]CAJ0805798.1 HTH-type transcriptional regulator YofA [Ralstonia sp. LMG 32967]
MDALQLQSFVMVVEMGSLSEAAKKLGVTPAAIGARVRALEDDIGVTLVKRTGRFVKPTLAGTNILERSRGVLRELRDLRTAAHSGASIGELRLGVFPTAMTSLLPSVLKRLFSRQPDLKILVSSGTSIELCCKVDDGTLDAAIVVEPQFSVPKACEWRALIAEPLVLVVPRALVGCDAHAVLRREPFIRYDQTLLGGQLAERYLREHAITPHERLELDNVMAIAALVDKGLGVALLPDWEPLWHSGMDIARVTLPHRAPTRRVGLISAIHGPRASLAQTFFTEAKAALREPSDAK